MSGRDLSGRKPGHLYVVLGAPFDSERHSHVEPFVEVEDNKGKGVGSESVRSFAEEDYRLLEFPRPQEPDPLREAAPAMLEALRKIAAAPRLDLVDEGSAWQSYRVLRPYEDGEWADADDTIEIARAAIAKVTGEEVPR